MLRQKEHRSAETLLMLLVFGVFAVLAILLTLMGARAYRSISEQMEENNALRSSLSYVANKVRAGDEAGGVRIEERGGIRVLCLSETVDGDTYETLLYFADGWLREYAAVAGYADEIEPDSGEKIVELYDFSMQMEGNRLTLTAAATERDSVSLNLTVRSEGEALP